ncbi:hypothetical protein [Natrinema soli]|uniref:Uncharacterized protein n=1 Tax=Natrinema soli TaxID=1930624 RepID=A0ABD5SZJ7_9EURY|nr:hypothetical protein [Natrinema soli]
MSSPIEELNTGYDPERNDFAGGSITLGDQYLFPVEFPVDTVRSILEDQVEDYGHEIRDSTDPYFSIDTGDSARYDLLYTDEDEGVKAIAEYDTDIGEAMSFWKIEELLEEQR